MCLGLFDTETTRGTLNKSFPRMRESRNSLKALDARFRGHDDFGLNQSFPKEALINSLM